MLRDGEYRMPAAMAQVGAERLVSCWTRSRNIGHHLWGGSALVGPSVRRFRRAGLA